MSKLKTCIVALVLAFLLVLAAAMPIFPSVNAYAEEETLADIYVFTDNDENWYNSMQTEDLFWPPYTERFYWEDFEDEAREYYAEGNFSEIANAYVIFEMSKGFKSDYNDGIRLLFTDLLEDVFSGMKERDCKIMFICATDEVRFISYNEFLDYVDVHVNTDTFTPFIDTVLCMMEENDIKDIFLDQSLSVSDIFDPAIFHYNEFYSVYLIPYLRYIHNLPAGENFPESYPTDSSVISYVTGERILNIHNWYEYSDLMAFYDEIFSIDISTVFAIGTTDVPQDFMFWYAYILELRDMMGANFPIFISNEGPYFWEFDNRTNNIYSMNPNFVLQAFLPSITYTFLMDEDLSVFDNWPGRCNVTFKPLLSGEDGWIRPARPLDYLLIYRDLDIVEQYGEFTYVGGIYS